MLSQQETLSEGKLKLLKAHSQCSGWDDTDSGSQCHAVSWVQGRKLRSRPTVKCHPPKSSHTPELSQTFVSVNSNIALSSKNTQKTVSGKFELCSTGLASMIICHLDPHCCL